MPPVEQAKLWGLRAALRKLKQDNEQYLWMSGQVHVKGGGHPSREAVRRFFLRVDEDKLWHPGKRGEVGRPVLLSAGKRKR